jgi:hypothetical protein
MKIRSVTTIGLVFALLLSTTSAHAEGFSDVQQAARLKRAGQSITGAAIALHLVGTALMLGWLGAGMSGLHEGGAAVQASANAATLASVRDSGTALLAASGALVVIGVPMWSIGARRDHQARAAIGATATGMVLRF